jgi:hypothetical protein
LFWGWKLSYLLLCAVLRIRIQCLFDPWIRDPGWVKKSGSGSGINNPDHISVLRNHFFVFKYWNSWCGSGIQNGKNSDPGSQINIPDPQHWVFVYTDSVIYQSMWIQVWKWIQSFLIHTGSLNNKFITEKTKHFSHLFFNQVFVSFSLWTVRYLHFFGLREKKSLRSSVSECFYYAIYVCIWKFFLNNGLNKLKIHS